ncbi:hypothetical protein AAF712_015729 [Marasmius tenuissimus]|uniref:Uncharacterized protein n=1 Tax=Marasmius tenuissimus TaxID=585030 RepID=A0ABR2ZA07_9AGAR
MPLQGMFTHMNTFQASLASKIWAIKETYCCARATLLALRGDSPWAFVLHVLKDEDICSFGKRGLKKHKKEEWHRAQELTGVDAGRIDKVLSGGNANIPAMSFNWIWYMLKPKDAQLTEVQEQDGDSFEQIQDSLHSEWCKAQASSRQPCEEIWLVEEEMRCSINFCLYMEGWCMKQIGRQEGLSEALQEGLTVYAAEHTLIEKQHALHWLNAWFKICERAKLILRHLSDAQYDTDLLALPLLEVELDLDEEEERVVVDNDEGENGT